MIGAAGGGCELLGLFARELGRFRSLVGGWGCPKVLAWAW